MCQIEVNDPPPPREPNSHHPSHDSNDMGMQRFSAPARPGVPNEKRALGLAMRLYRTYKSYKSDVQ